MKRNTLKTRLVLLCMVLGLGSFSAFAQKDILLYSTDFTDWTALAHTSSSSNPFQIATGAGAGFTVTQDADVVPTASALPGSAQTYGKYWLGGSTSGRTLGFKPLNFIQGAVVEVLFELTGSSSNRSYTVTGGTVTQAMIDEFVAASTSGTVDYTSMWAGTSTNHFASGTGSAAKQIFDGTNLGQWFNGTSVQAPKYVNGYMRVSFYLPSVAGNNIALTLETLRQDMPIRQLKIYTSVGSTPYVAATNYQKAPAPGHTLQGAIGGAINSGTPVNALINAKAWNITGDVTLEIIGTDASKFAITGAGTDGKLIVPNATIKNPASFNVPITFTPSVREGVATAQLKISAAGAPDYIVSLTGITGGGSTPKILASTATIPFWTSLIAPVTKTLSLAGVNLTGNVTATVGGTGAERFSLFESPISKANATAGYILSITYTGDIEASEQNCYLVLKSPGATDVKIPLYAVTEDTRPVLYTLNFAANPAGSAFLDLSLAGPEYKAGTQISVSVLPETGYAIDYWSDNTGSHSANRTFYVTTNRTITVFLKPVASCPCPPTCICGGGEYQAFTPLEATITDDGFPAGWTSQTDATAYTVIVYDKTGTVVKTLPVALTNQLNITGLKPAAITEEADLLFWYEVEAATPSGAVKTAQIGPVRLGGTVPFTCGQ